MYKFIGLVAGVILGALVGIAGPLVFVLLMYSKDPNYGWFMYFAVYTVPIGAIIGAIVGLIFGHRRDKKRRDS